MGKVIEFKCKENDNLIKYLRDDDEPTGEYWFSDEIGKSWIVIGEKDMKKIMKEVAK